MRPTVNYAFVIVTALAQACVAAPMPGPTYYVVSASASSEASVTTEAGLQVLDSRAPEALRPGLTVAFFPPDRCRGDLSSAAATATPEATEMANDCGVLISALETSVADRYSVVSWQTIKGIDPFERAAARNVDVIFEVDSMGLNQLGQDASSHLRLDFAQQTGPSDRTSLTLGPAQLPVVASRCKPGIEQTLASRPDAAVRSFTGAIKAVEVSSGKALVYYNRTLTDQPSSNTDAAVELYYQAPAQPDPTNPSGYNTLQRAGSGAAGTGFVVTFLGAFLRGVVYEGKLDADDYHREPGTSASVGMIVAGSVLLVGGAAMIFAGNAKAKRSVRQVTYAPPADVLCMQPVVPPWLQQTATPQGGSSYSFDEAQTAARDNERERENRLRKLLIDDFTHALAQLDAPG
jgi:hypothetical protein